MVVFISIDNFNLEYINKFSSLMGNDGLKRMIKRGTRYKNVDIDYAFPASATGIESIVSGTNPNIHGIIADDYVVRGTFIEKCICEDDITKPKEQRYNNSQVLVTNLTDELAISYPQSKAFSISFDPCNANYFVGKKFGTAAWFDEDTGDWISNDTNSIIKDIFINKAILNETWKPLYPAKIYIESDPFDVDFELDVENKNKRIIKSLSERNRKLFSYVKATPFANTYTTDLAIQLIENKQIGTDRHPDILHVNYKAMDYIAKHHGVLSAKYHDAFYRLDSDIARLLNSIDSKVGLNRCLVVLTTPKPSFYTYEDMKKLGVETGTIELNGAIKLLNLYLNKKYNRRMLIEACNGQEIYLNHTLIKKHKINKDRLVREIIEMLPEVSGVKKAYSVEDLLAGRHHNEFAKRLSKNYSDVLSGDIYIEPKPGWTTKTVNEKKMNVLNSCSYNLPLLLYGWGMNEETRYERININDICPTICDILKINIPATSKGVILNLGQ
jgi:hypothetical protein